MSRIHYPMTYTNYPFNAIWATVKLSRPSSRTFPASLTQKHQLEISLVSKHCVDTGRSRAFQFRTGHVKIGVVYPECSWQGVRARACVAVAGDRLLALNGRSAEGRSSHRLTPSELTKITNCDCPLIKRGNFTLQRHTCSFDTRRAGAAGALDTRSSGI